MREAFQAWLDNKGTKLWFIAKIQKWAVVGLALALAAVFFAITSCATQGNIASVHVIDGNETTNLSLDSASTDSLTLYVTIIRHNQKN